MTKPKKARYRGIDIVESEGKGGITNLGNRQVSVTKGNKEIVSFFQVPKKDVNQKIKEIKNWIEKKSIHKRF